MAKRVLGISIQQDRLHLTEVLTRTRSLKILTMIEESLPREFMPNQLVDVIAELAKKHGIKAKYINITIPRRLVETNLITVPIMSARELRNVVQREIVKMTRSGHKELSYDYQKVDEVYEKGIRKARIMITTTEQENLDANMELIRELSKRPGFISTNSYALMAMYYLSQGKTFPPGKIAFAYLGSTSSLVCIFQGHNLLFSREIRAGVKEGENEALDHIVSEIKRTLLYFNQIDRSEGVETCLIAGRIQGRENKIRDAAAAIDLPLEPFSLSTPSIIQPPSGTGEYLSISDYTLAIGCAFLEELPYAVNFIPYEYYAKRYRLVGRLVTAALIAFMVIVLAGGYLGLSRALSIHQRNLQSHNNMLGVLTEQMKDNLTLLEEIEKLEKKRTELENLTSGYPDYVAFLTEISSITPPSIILQDLTISRNSDSWRATMSGFVIAQDQPTAQRIIHEYIGLLKASPSVVGFKLRQASTGIKEKKSHGGLSVLDTASESDDAAIGGTITFEIELALKGAK